MLNVELYIEEIAAHERGTRRAAEEAAVAKLVRRAFGADAERYHEPDGAPYIQKECMRLLVNFSISHSRRYAVLAVDCSATGKTAGADIGVDIESDRPQLVCVCRRMLSAGEYEEYEDCLVRAWTAKEAVYKASRRYFDAEPEYATAFSLAGDTATAHTPGGDRHYTLLYIELCGDTICVAREKQ